jgi:peroxiredoxin
MIHTPGSGRGPRQLLPALGSLAPLAQTNDTRTGSTAVTLVSLALALTTIVAVCGCSSNRTILTTRELPYYITEKRTLRNVVFMHYWSASSAGCLASLGQVVELHERFAGRGLVVASVNLDGPQSWPRAQEAIERFDLPYPVFRDPERRLLRRHARELPSVASVRSFGVLLRDDLVVARGTLCQPEALGLIRSALERILPEE